MCPYCIKINAKADLELWVQVPFLSKFAKNQKGSSGFWVINTVLITGRGSIIRVSDLCRVIKPLRTRRMFF